VARLAALDTRIGRVWVDLLRFFAVYHRRRYGWDGSPIHDAVAVAHLAAPGLVTSRLMRVDVETAGELTRGRTVADPEGLRGLPDNVEVGVDSDRGRFADLLVDAIAAFD
jgi:inosine-uridine nucleoside N-ribohydrolase